MKDDSTTSVEASRGKLLAAIAGAPDVTFVRGYGNIGDHLIYAGTRQLLAAVTYREVSMLDLEGVHGHTALLSGSGAWCHAFQAMEKYLAQVEERFERVIMLPSSFDVSVERVRVALAKTKALVFARERESYRQIKDLCNADLAHDTAFYFDFTAYRRAGQGTLNAFRQDPEASGLPLPRENNDISLTCESLDEWLWTIARHERVRTDRAHVIIAAALLGKTAAYRPSNYHKVPAIVEFALSSYPVTRIADEPDEAQATADSSDSFPVGPVKTALERRVDFASKELAELIPHEAAWILVDEDQLRGDLPHAHVIPFLEEAGEYCGPPENDETAIREFERLRQAGARFMVFAWPAFWWLDHYSRLRRHLNSRFRAVRQDEHLVVYDLRVAGD